jgi:FMN phosphatase YigB (HAD superfamily)
MMDPAEILKEAEKFDVVSFDVFDTLLLRPYVQPTDLFRHIESRFKRRGFAGERIRAERTARSKEFEEVTLDEIYEEIDDRFKDLKDSELLLERQVLLPNPEIRKVFDAVKSSGKRIVLLSDMYLPSVFLSEILKKNGFEGYERLYMSCEYRKSKHSGELYSLVLKELGIGPGDIVHIGDGDVSDVKRPSKMGIRALRYTKVIDRYFSEHKREYRYYRRKKSLGRSVTVAVDALHSLKSQKDNFWYELGYRYGGPVNSSFATFIERTAEKDGVLLFVARDGYNAQRAYNIMYGDIENHYVYAVRTFNILFGINGRDYPGYEDDIAGFFSEHPEVKGLEGNKKDLFGENRQLFEALMSKELEKYSSYIKKYTGSKEHIYVVDATTEKFSSQKLIGTASGKKTTGIYFTLLYSRSDGGAAGFHDGHKAFLNLTSIDLPEFLMTSGEGRIRGIDGSGKPVYFDDPAEPYRKHASGMITAGSDDYAKELVSIFGEYMPEECYEPVGAWLRSFWRGMSPDETENMKAIRWASDPAHSEYHDLIFSMSDVPLLIKNKFRDYFRSIMNRLRNG